MLKYVRKKHCHNGTILIHENVFNNVVCKIAAICLGLNVLKHATPLYPLNLWQSTYKMKYDINSLV